MNYTLNFISRLGKIILVYTFTFVSPAIIIAFIHMDITKYFYLLEDNAYCGGMTIVSILTTIMYCVYICAEHDSANS